MTDARPIVVGYDGRAGSQAALDEALRLAGELGAPLVIVFSFAVSRLGGEVADLEAAIEDRGREALAEAIGRVGHTDVSVDTEMLGEPPAEALVTVADARDAQMLIVGSRGEGPVRGILIGSTPYKLLHLSSRPVLVVRQGD